MRAGSGSRASTSVAATKLVSAGPAATSGSSVASTRYPATKSSSESSRRPIPYCAIQRHLEAKRYGTNDPERVNTTPRPVRYDGLLSDSARSAGERKKRLVRTLHRESPAGRRPRAGRGPRPQAQLHRHRAHPARPAPRGGGPGGARARVARHHGRGGARAGRAHRRPGRRGHDRPDPVHAAREEGAGARAARGALARPQLHRHRAHPARPRARERGRRRAHPARLRRRRREDPQRDHPHALRPRPPPAGRGRRRRARRRRARSCSTSSAAT